MPEENKAIVRRLIEGFLNSGDPNVADELFAAGYVDHSPTHQELGVLENVKKSVGE